MPVTDDTLNKAVEDAEVDKTDASELAIAATDKSDSEVEEETEDLSSVKKEDEKSAPKKEETEQQFRSGLGRRVSRIEESIGSFMNEMRATLSNFHAQPLRASSEENVEIISTAEDVERVLERREQQRQSSIRAYENTYLDHLAKLGSEEGLANKEFDRLDELVRTSFNKSYSNYKDPVADAERNFLKAMRVIDKEKLGSHDKEKHVNLKGDVPKGTGVSSASKVVEDSKPAVKLDQYAQDLVNHYKMSEESVVKSLGLETKKK